MRKFWGFYKNEKYSVGCSGKMVYVYDAEGKELDKFRNFNYAYVGAFKPHSNIIAVKSTEGVLGFYDLDSLSLVKKITITRIGAQDEGFAFSPDGKWFYNIEKPISSNQTQLSIYDTEAFEKVCTLFDDEKKMVLDDIEFDKETGCGYVLGFMRDDNYGVYEYGFVGKFDVENNSITNIQRIDENQFEYLQSYKAWERSGFTEKSLEWSPLHEMKDIKETSIKSVYNKLCNN